MIMSKLSIETIRDKIAPICKNYDISKAYLFGSYARGEARDDSDVDIRIDKGNSHKLRGLIEVSGLQLELMDALGKQVDLITLLPNKDVYSVFNKNVSDEEVLLYEAK